MRREAIALSHALRYSFALIIGIYHRAVEEAFVAFQRETARIGLLMNTTKTKYMTVSGQRGFRFQVVKMVLDGETFEEFVYFR